MSDLFLRRYSLTVGTLRVTGLRCSFTIAKSLTKEPNTCEIKVWNLSKETRDALEPARSTGRRDRVVLAAGYKDSASTIYSGDLRYVDSTKEGPSWVTKLTAGDGEAITSKVSLAVRPGTPVVDVIHQVAGMLGINRGNLQEALQRPLRGGVREFSKGKALTGDATEVLDSLMRSAGFTASIQDGRLTVLREGQVVGEGRFVLGPASGLIGSPQYGTQDAKDRRLGRSPRLVAKSLLQPLLGCGSAVKIDSDAYRTTNYRVEKVTHTGDTHGKDWYTTVELKPIGEASPITSGYEPDPDPEVLE